MPQYTVADARYAFQLPEGYSDAEAAPLLCAGLIGYRSLKLAGDRTSPRHLWLRRRGAYRRAGGARAGPRGLRLHPARRPASAGLRARASAPYGPEARTTRRPQALDAAIIFAPVGALVPAALRAVRKGGVVVCGGIHMSDIPSFPYDILWEERVLRSVANLTRADAREFLALAPKLSVKTSVSPMPLAAANEALERLRRGELTGAAVLIA